MVKAVVCPVCGGIGAVAKAQPTNSTSATPIVEKCHGCQGRGWIEVSG